MLAGGDFRHHSLPCRMIVGSWLFAILVFNNAFTGSLISMITNQKFQYVIQSIEDVATDEDVCTTAHHQRIQYTFRIQGVDPQRVFILPFILIRKKQKVQHIASNILFLCFIQFCYRFQLGIHRTHFSKNL